jgi:hypothetical protein
MSFSRWQKLMAARTRSRVREGWTEFGASGVEDAGLMSVAGYVAEREVSLIGVDQV